MIVGRLKFRVGSINNDRADRITRQLRRYVIFYVKGLFSEKKENATTLAQLKKFEENIALQYGKHVNIKSVLINIAKNLYIDKDGYITIKPSFTKGIRNEVLFKLITYGSLSIKGVNVIYPAVNKSLTIIKAREAMYGC